MLEQVDVLDKGFVRLVDMMGSDEAIVQAARVSYGKGTKKVSEDEGLIRYLLRHSHTTPFEMVQFKFHIKLPIFVVRQWHRHRMWSYNEYSGRYSEMKDEFYVPQDQHFTKQNPTNKQGGTDEAIPTAGKLSWSELFAEQQQKSRQDYENFLTTGVRRELARVNLPLAQYTEMYASVDLHNLFHFLRLRLDSHAQYEIRVYAEAISRLIAPRVPIAYRAFEDYVLGSVKFSAKELKILRQLIGHASDIKTQGSAAINAYLYQIAEENFSNKRERSEAIAKILPLLEERGDLPLNTNQEESLGENGSAAI
ncbi:MAG TPA: FAD-dependent thymidylate synthase [Oligoflexia bacterium]|nr:FAD-dependent thymidylate synthase [Oligoflexia bacterium]HMP27857.1 FAD-dependent thymidylate synthase [Oligoflexia bacterium]